MCRFSRVCIGLVLWGLFASCSKVPDGILSEKMMQRVMTDMLMAESLIGIDYDTYKNDTVKAALYESVFRKYDIDKAVYDSSLIWYGQNLDIYMEVYERVLADVNKRIVDLGDVQADAAPTSNQDSVNIWPRRAFLTFSPHAVFNAQTFDIHPSINFPSGSRFVLGMRFWGLDRHHRPRIRLAAEQGDTTVVVDRVIDKDGYHEVALSSVSTKRIKRVYGYISLDSNDSTYFKVYVDSLSLMRYNYGREATKTAKAVDSDGKGE